MDYSYLRKENPWAKVVDEWLQGMKNHNRQYDFVLPEDKVVLDAYKPTDASRHALIRNIPPEPFVGKPEAKIWFVLKNPGGGEWNECDFLCGRTGLSQANIQFSTDAADSMLSHRQEMYARQLKLEGDSGKEFYLLDPSFCTAKRGGRMPRCIYWWYRTRFLCNEGIFSSYVDIEDEDAILSFLSKNVFVLDYFPYHSNWFDDVELKVSHSDFWHVAMLEALKDSEKMFVFWGSKIVRHIKADNELSPLYAKAVSDRRVLIMKGQQAYFSESSTFLPFEGDELMKSFVK